MLVGEAAESAVSLCVGFLRMISAASLGSTQELGPAPPSKRAARWALVRVGVRVMVRVREVRR